MKEQRTNYPAIAVCTLLSMVIPALWYMIFAEPWMEGNGLTEANIEDGHSAYPYLIALVSSIVATVSLSFLNIKLGGDTLLKGAMIGLFVGIAFSLIPTFTQYAFSMRPNTLSLIDGGVNTFVWTVVGGILGAWKKYNS